MNTLVDWHARLMTMPLNTSYDLKQYAFEAKSFLSECKMRKALTADHNKRIPIEHKMLDVTKRYNQAADKFSLPTLPLAA